MDVIFTRTEAPCLSGHRYAETEAAVGFYRLFNRPPRKLTKHRPACPFAVMLCPFSLKYIPYSCGKQASPDSEIAASYDTSPVSEDVY